MPATAIHALPYPTQVPAGPGPDVPADIKALTDALDTKLTPFVTGAGTPAALSIPAGKAGRRLLNSLTGDIYLDIGAAWVLEFDYEADAGNGIGITGRSIAVRLLGTGGGSGLTFAGDGSLQVNSDEVTVERSAGALRVKDAAVTAAKIAASLKPSGGAAAATEALRALGVAAGTAAAGNDARFPVGPDIDTVDIADNAITQAKMADNSVGNAELADNAVGQAEIADDAVGQAETVGYELLDLAAVATGDINVPTGTWRIVVIDWELETSALCEVRLAPNALAVSYHNVRDGSLLTSGAASAIAAGGNTVADTSGIRIGYPPAAAGTGGQFMTGRAIFQNRALTGVIRACMSQGAVGSITVSGNQLIELQNIACRMISNAAITFLRFSCSAGTMTGRITARFQ